MDRDRHAGDLGGDDIDVVGQRHGCVHRGRGQVREEEGRAGEEDRCGFADRPFQPQDDAGDDARQCLRQDHLADGLPLRSAQRDADHAEFIGDAAQRFFGRADDDGQGHDGERQRGGDDADAELEEQDE